MRDELLSRASELFDTADKWSTFCELSALLPSIRRNFLKAAKSKILNKLDSVLTESWSYEPFGDTDIDMMIYLKEFGPNSLNLNFRSQFEFHLYLHDSNKYDCSKMTELLGDSEFNLILTGFGRIDHQFQNLSMGMERRNYTFNSANDGNYSADELSWHIAHHTDVFVEQLIQKVSKFTANNEITDKLIELHHRCVVK